MSLELHRQPPGLFQILTRGPWPANKNRAGGGTAFPGEVRLRWHGESWGTARGGRTAPSGARGAMRDGRRRRIDRGGRSAAERTRRRGGSGGRGWKRRGWGAARGRSEARCGVDLGGATVEARLDCGLEARRRSVERRRRSGVSGQGKSERARKRNEESFLEPRRARGKGEIGVLSWAIHGGVRGGGRLDSSGWRGEGRGHQRDGKGRWGVSGRRVEATRSRRWRGEAAQSGGGRRGAVGGEKQRNREGKKTGT